MSPSSFHYFRVTLLHFTLSVILFESDACLFVFSSILSSLSSILVSKVHNNLLNRSCLRHALTTIQKKCLLCTNQCVLFLSFLSIFGCHLFGNMTPKLNRGCVTFIEHFVHFLHFKLMSQEPMSLFSLVGMLD